MYIINNQPYTVVGAITLFEHTLAGCETVLIGCVRIDFVECWVEVKEEDILIYLDNLCVITVEPNKNLSFVFVGHGTIEINNPNFLGL